MKRTTVKIIKDYMIYSQGGHLDIRDEVETNDHSSTEQQDRGETDSWLNLPDMELFVTPNHWEHIKEAIGANTCVAVTDGSYDPTSKLSTACWIIEGRTLVGRAKGAVQTPGNRNCMDAHRAELHGIYCIHHYIYNICSKFKITTGRVTVACDCNGALFCALKYQCRPALSHPNFDLLWAIHDLQKIMPIDINYIEVKGHQDTALLDRPLTRLERLNCEADAGAKEYLNYVRRHKLQATHALYGTQWQLCHGRQFIYTRLKESLYDVCHGTPLRFHIMQKRGYSEQTFDCIDWAAVKHARKSMSTAERTWLTKHVGRYNPTGCQMLRRKYWSDSRCPRCDEPDEDLTHVVTCTHPEVTELRKDLIIQMSDEMKRYGTLDAIRMTIVLTLLDDQTESFSSNVPEFDGSYQYGIHKLLLQAASEQDTIGKQNFFDGHVSSMWRKAQEADNSSRQNGTTWSKRLIQATYPHKKTMGTSERHTLSEQSE